MADPLDVKWFFKAMRWLTGMELRGISLIRIRFTFAGKIKHMYKDKKTGFRHRKLASLKQFDVENQMSLSIRFYFFTAR